MNTLKRFLSPPVFADDAEKTRVASILNVIILSNLGVALLALLVLPFSARPMAGLAAITPLLTFEIAGLLLLRAGHVYGAAKFFATFLFLLITGLIVITGGLNSSETAGYIVVVATAGMLIGISAIPLFTGLCIAGLLLLFGLETAGLMPPPLLPFKPLGGMMIGSINLLLVSVILYLTLHSLRRALTTAQRNGQALGERNRDLETIRASLEDQVTLRTQVAETARREAEAANAALQEQMWHIRGLAQLSELPTEEPDVTALATAALEHVCAYIDAPVGALYLWEEQYLVLTAAHACPPELTRNRRFAPGEGLIGQVAAEKCRHVLTAGTRPLRLTSSFGEIALAQVYVYPLLYGGAVIGVLEIGRLTPFTPAQTQFLTQALERLAALLHTIQAQAQINLLLHETQQQAEELQAQEETLRATNEELAAQAEALRRAPLPAEA